MKKMTSAAGGFISRAVCVILFLLFSALSAISLAYTTGVNTDNAILENIVYRSDGIFQNLLLCAVFFVFLYLSRSFFMRASVPDMTILLLIWTFILGSFWILSVLSVPAHDSSVVSRAALMASDGDFSFLKPAERYFYNFPFQLGYVLFGETLFRVFRAVWSPLLLQFINLYSLLFSYVALIRLSGHIFKSAAAQRLTVFLLFFCAPPVLFCTFVYGNLPGLAFALWGTLYAARLLSERRKALLAPAALLLAASCALKPNCMIFLAAVCVFYLIAFLKTRRVLPVIAACVLIAAVIGANRLVALTYELRADVRLGGGIPKLLWMNMGLNEAESAPGWYNGAYTVTAFRISGCDASAASEKAKREISERLSCFIKNPGYAAEFFYYKTVSAWNEPSFQSVWVSQTKGHSGEAAPLAASVYDGAAGRFLTSFMNGYQQLIYIGAAACAFFLLKKPSALHALLPLIVLGGFFYHLLFETKSQYILPYFIVLVPLAAYGFARMLFPENGQNESESDFL